MEVTIPEIPTGILTLLAFFAPYAVAAVNGAVGFVEKPWQRKAVSVVVAVALAALVLVLYIALTGDIPTSWPIWFLWSVLIVTASYALVTKRSAAAVEARTSAER